MECGIECVPDDDLTDKHNNDMFFPVLIRIYLSSPDTETDPDSFTDLTHCFCRKLPSENKRNSYKKFFFEVSSKVMRKRNFSLQVFTSFLMKKKYKSRHVIICYAFRRNLAYLDLK